MKVLITGGAGFIGSHLAELLQGDAEVRVLDDLSCGALANLGDLTVDFREGSILDEDALGSAMKGVDYVFHLAARTSVAESVEKPEAYVETNVEGTAAVLRAASEAGVKKVVLASSASVYGDSPVVPKVETMVPEPKSPYAATKLEAEIHAAFYAEKLGLPTASLRFFNVFGPRQNPKSAYAAVVPAFIDHALRGEGLVIHGDGGQTRDFIAIRDIVSALRFAALNEQVVGVCNCGYGESMTVRELAEKIIALAGSSSQIEYAPVRAGDVRHSRASVEKLRGWGWQPASSLDHGLAETIADFRSRL